MKRSKNASKQVPQYDYALALQNAVSWLGDRYLLAEPARRIEQPRPFFVETPSWHEPRRSPGTPRRH